MKTPDDIDNIEDENPDDENGKENNFDPFEYWDEEAEESYQDELERLNKSDKLPILKKAMEIANITHRLVETIDEKKDTLQMKNFMRENAFMLGAKISGAEGGDIYFIRMECAMLVKIHARELITQTTYCKIENLCNQEYLQLLRDELEEFRKMYIDWVKSFDSSNDIPDDWGTFSWLPPVDKPYF